MADSRNRRSPDPLTRLPQSLLKHLRAAVEAADWGPGGAPALSGLRCVVGLSGGVDSMALLHALAGLREYTPIQVSALHVHHGLSPNADRWAAQCQEFCKLLTLPLRIERVGVDRHSGLGLEAAARQARYAAFRDVDADLLLLAHHAGDQAETLLFNLMRGTGLRGAAAMPVTRFLSVPMSESDVAPAAPLMLLRPWLAVSRAEIEAYVGHFALDPVADESNDDLRFSRNFIRHTLLPPLVARFPGALERMAGAARRLAEAQELTDDLADLDLATVARAGPIDLAPLHSLSVPRQRNVLRRWMALRGLRLGEEALDELCRQMRDASADAQIALPLGAVTLRVWRGGLHAVPSSPKIETAAVERLWPVSETIEWADGVLRFESSVGQGVALPAGARVQFRTRQGGERIRLRANGPSQAVKTLLQAAAVPPWHRQCLPCLWIDGELVAVVGLGVAAQFVAQVGQPGHRVTWDSVPAKTSQC